VPGLRSSAFSILLLSATALAQTSAPATAPTTAPVGSLENPQHVTAADVGPDIDSQKLLDSPFRGLPFRTFDSFVSGSFAAADVWVYADAGDAEKISSVELIYPYPKFYKPTWREVFDHVARQMRCAWDWNPKNRQFRFAPTDAPPFFSVKLGDGWRREDRGLYVWHAPKEQDFGMDIYYYGHFTANKDEPDLFEKVRTHFAERELSQWPNPPTAAQMKLVKVGDHDALYLQIDTPRPGGVWRQWSIVIDGHAFVIVSAMPKEREATLVPAIEQMVNSFTVTAPVSK
jgi:hypothetical protein